LIIKDNNQQSTLYTYRLFTLSTETVAALKTGDFKLVSIIDEPIRTLRRGEEERRKGEETVQEERRGNKTVKEERRGNRGEERR